MKMRKNTLFGILLSFMLVLGSIPLSSLMAYADDDDRIMLDFLGISVMEDSSGEWSANGVPYTGVPIRGSGWVFDGKTLSGGDWEFDTDSCTITMDGMEFSGKKGFYYLSGPKPLTINLNGDNSITTNGGCGIESFDGIVINGPGSLTVDTTKYSSCVDARYMIRVNGGEILVTGTEVNQAVKCASLDVAGGELTAIASARKKGISVGLEVSGENAGDVTVRSGATLTAKGGDTDVLSCGMSVGRLTVNNGTVNATAGKSYDYFSVGIVTSCVDNVSIVVNGGTVTAAAGDAYGTCTGIECYGLKVIDGTVTAAAGNSEDDNSFGVYSMGSSVLDFSGGTVIASAGKGKDFSYGLACPQTVVGSGIRYVEAKGYTRAIHGLLDTHVNATGWTDYEGTYGDAFLPIGNYIGYDHFGKDVFKRKVQFPDVVKLPVFSPQGGTYNAEQSVTLCCATEGADIYYTTDGTDPSPENGQKYTEAFTVTIPSTIKAVSVKSGMTNSAIVTAEYRPATVTVNTKTVTEKSLNTALAKAGASRDTVKTIVLGKSVSKISKGAFSKCKKAKTLVVKTKKLKKSSVKYSLKGSQITKVKVQVGSAKTNRSYVKKYKKIFTKTNAGKTVKVTL